MAMTRYFQRNPWRELDQLTNRLSQMFDESGYPMPSSAGSWAPAVSVEETQDELVLVAELPGMSAEDVDVQIENNILTLRGTKTEERKEEDESHRVHLWERSYGSFERSFTLPHTVRADAVSAEFDNGLLRVRMPKAPESKSRRIEVHGGAAKEVGSGRASSNGGKTEEKK